MLERLLDLFGSPLRARRLSGHDDAPLFELRFRNLKGKVVFLPTAGCEYSPLELDLLFTRGRIRVIDSERRIETFVSKPDPTFKGFFNLVPGVPPPMNAITHEGIIYSIDAVLQAADGEPSGTALLERGVLVSRILETVGAG